MTHPTRRLRRLPSAARRSALALAVLLASVVAACAPRGPVADPPEAVADSAEALPAAGIPEAILEVQNQSNYDVRVYVVTGGQSRRLGFVTSRQSAQLGLPSVYVGRDVRFRAVPVGYRRTQTTDVLVVRPGQVVRFGLEKELRSHTLVYY